MVTPIDKAIVGLILAVVASLTAFTGDTTLGHLIEAAVVAVGVWIVPNA